MPRKKNRGNNKNYEVPFSPMISVRVARVLSFFLLFAFLAFAAGLGMIISSLRSVALSPSFNFNFTEAPYWLWYIVIGLGIIFFVLLIVLAIAISRRKKDSPPILLDNALLLSAKKFIAETRRRGYNTQEIKSLFIKKGWSNSDIARVFI